MRTLRFKTEFGFVAAGRLLKEDVGGNFFLAQSDDEFIAGSTPWVGSVKLRPAYVQTLIGTVLEEITPGN